MARSPHRRRSSSRLSRSAARRFNLPWNAKSAQPFASRSSVSQASISQSSISQSSTNTSKIPELTESDKRPNEAESSRLTRRLQERVVRHRPRLSWLVRRLEAKRSRQRFRRRTAAVVLLSLAIGGGIWGNLFVKERVTLGGVPYRIVHKFWNDPIARAAYFSGDSRGLHDRLRSLGVEADIKDYYRDRFATEQELDRHIHQIMYDRTGYVGQAYQVTPSGQLVLISSSRP